MIPVPPSQFTPGSGAVAGVWARGVPLPGIGAASPGSAWIRGTADCRNLFAMSPPTLLEAYEVASYAIGWGIYIAAGSAFARPPVFTAEMAFLVNGEVRFVAQNQVDSVLNTAGLEATGSGTWIGDLVNPIIVGARDRLALRMGFVSDLAGPANSFGVVGAQLVPGAVATTTPAPSTISYRTLSVPGARRL